MTDTEQTPFFAALDAWLAAQPDASPDAAQPGPAPLSAADWRARYMELRELILLVEDLSDDFTQVNAQALVDAFRAFRNLVEGNTPRVWVVGAPELEPGGGDAEDAERAEDAVPWA